MTRGEKIQFAINVSRSDCGQCTTKYACFDCPVDVVRTILLAEQKRVDGCDKCNDDRIREIQIDSGFEFCPHCGRDLTEGDK